MSAPSFSASNASSTFANALASAPTGYTLRDYQQRAVDEVYAARDAGLRRILFVAPTGAGKTVIFSKLVCDAWHARQQVLIIAHRKELLTQARSTLFRSIPRSAVGIFRGMKNPGTQNRNAPILITSIQAKNGLKGFDLLKPALIITDEAHHSLAESYKALYAMYPDALKVGATATAFHGRGKGLGEGYDKLIQVTTTMKLTTEGRLVLARVFTHANTLRDLDYRRVKIGKDGEFNKNELARVMMGKKLVGNIPTHWKEHANGMRTVLFAASVEHSKSCCKQLKKAGIAAVCIDMDTSPEERERILGTPEHVGTMGEVIAATPGALERGEVKVVCNFNVLTEGYDAPWLECVVLARPTRSALVYLQAVGRGLRSCEGKKEVVVLDHAGLCLAFGLPEVDRPCSLEGLVRAQGRVKGEMDEGAESGEDGTEPDCIEGEEAGARGDAGVGRDGRMPVLRCKACGYCGPRAETACRNCRENGREEVMEEPEGVLVEVVREVFGEKTKGAVITYNGKNMTITEFIAVTGLRKSIVYRKLLEGETPEDIATKTHRPATLVYRDKTYLVLEFCRETGISFRTAYERMKDGQSGDEIVAAVAELRPMTVEIDGKSLSIADIAKVAGIGEETARRRYKCGLRGAELIAPAMSRHDAGVRAGKASGASKKARRESATQ